MSLVRVECHSGGAPPLLHRNWAPAFAGDNRRSLFTPPLPIPPCTPPPWA
ncbi:hypothetical protein SUS17_3658 [Sphingomonas sp. S17]|nr:hypothetical protein SUS17_3658 [Sphingomonas sp. S17]